MRTKISSLLLACVMGAAFAASGGDLDLTSEDKSVPSLAGYANVINTSDELRTLTVSPATDETFNGKISGKIKLVKEGKGFLRLTNNENDYTGGNLVNDGRLIAADVHTLGDPAQQIVVNSDCSQSMSSGPSNKITCVAFDKCATFAYPVHCTGWKKLSIGGSSYSRQYNIALTYTGTKLTGTLTCDDNCGVALHLGSLVCGTTAAASKAATGTGTTEVQGDVLCPNGIVGFSNFGEGITISGRIRAQKLAYDPGSGRPEVLTLSNSDNAIGEIVQAGSAANGRPLTASAVNALGGGIVYSVSDNLAKTPLLVLVADQTITALTRNPSLTTAMPSPMTSSNQHCHNVGTDAAATLTMTSAVDVVCDWWFKDGRPTQSNAQLGGDSAKPLSLVWAPTADCTLTTAGWPHSMHGTITVSRGTFVVDPNGSFANVSRVHVANGATFKVGSAGALGVITDVELEEGGSISVPEGVTLTVNSLKVGDKYCAAKTYEPGSKTYITGGGSLSVRMNPSGGEVDAVWTGGAGVDETGFNVGSNWDGGEAPDDETSVITAFFAKGGAEATLTKDTMLKGLVFDPFDGAVSDFTLAATGDGGIRLGVGGISNAVCSAVCNWTIAAPIEPIIDQVWKTAANAKLTVTGPMKKSAMPVTITHLPTTDGDAISFVGDNDSDFDGDYIVEQDEVSGRKSGDLFLSGEHPLGVGGKITLVGRESGKSGGHTEPQLVVSNAVVAKAVETKGFYNAYIVAKPDTTNTFEETVTSDSSLPFNLVLYGKSQFVFNKDVTVARKYSSKNLTSQYTIRSQTDDENRRGEVVFNGLVTHASTNYLNARIDVCFNAPSNRVKVIKFEDAAFSTVIRLGASYAFADGYTTLIPHTQVGAGNNHYNTLDLQGFSQHIGTLTGGSPLTTVRSTGGAAELRLNQTEDAEFKGVFADAVTLVKDGPATFALTNVCTATGALVVTNGVLELKDGAHWAGTRVEVAAGTLKLDGADTLTDAHVVELGATGAIDIPSDTTVTVRQLFYRDANGDLQPAPRGSYSSGGVPGGLPAELANRFTGGGTLFVRKNGRPMGFGIVFR